MEEIIALSSSSPLPVPVNGNQMNGVEDGDHVNGHSPNSLGLLGASPRKGDQIAVAPYQALPVTAATITEHITPALPVIEHGTMSQEVGWQHGNRKSGCDDPVGNVQPTCLFLVIITGTRSAHQYSHYRLQEKA